MSHQKPQRAKMEELPRQEPESLFRQQAEALTPEQAEQAKGGLLPRIVKIQDSED
jgi:hypothetical protein